MENQKKSGIDEANESIQKMYESNIKELYRRVKNARNDIEDIQLANQKLTEERLKLQGEVQRKLAEVELNQVKTEIIEDSIGRFLQEINEIKTELKDLQ